MKDYQADWDFYFCTIDEKAASLSLDLGMDNYAPLQSHPFRLWVSVLLQEPDERGLSTNEEYPVLCDIEDKMTESLEELNAIQVGRLTCDGKRELFFYSPTNKGFEDAVDRVMEQFPDYQYATDDKEDKKWEEYFDFLYPNPYQFQAIQNRRVVQQLEGHNDNLEKERPVDHWLYFADEAGMNDFCVAVKEEGFDTLSAKKLDDRGDKCPYQVNIVRTHAADWDTINELVWYLMDEADERNGYYDGWGCPIAKD